VIEAMIEINGQQFVLHMEGPDVDDTTKPQGLLGVRHQQTGASVKRPIDEATWQRVEQFIRFASR
jgi:hypothetical protein